MKPKPLAVLGVKSTNPKDIQGIKKIPFHLWPETATIVGVLQMLDGGTKYGRENYREDGVCASVYYDANRRHLNDWWHGEDRTPDTMLRHLGGVLASTAILIDSIVNGKFIDDRAYNNQYAALREELTGDIRRIMERNKAHKPIHYSRLLKDDTHSVQHLRETDQSNSNTVVQRRKAPRKSRKS